MKISYPVSKPPYYRLTPSNTIWICDKCGNAAWYWFNHTNFPICYCRKSKRGNPVRMRRGNKQEQEEAQKAALI